MDTEKDKKEMLANDASYYGEGGEMLFPCQDYLRKRKAVNVDAIIEAVEKRIKDGQIDPVRLDKDGFVRDDIEF